MANEAVEMEPSGRVLPIFRGEYDAGRTYENPDIVLYRNSSYVAKQVTVGNPPPAHALADDYWQMVAKGIIDADISESTVEFEEAKERANIKSGEKSNIIMGKIMKFFTDLKDIAFSGRYSDLIDAPISLKNPKALTFTGAVTGSYDGSTAKSVAIPSVGNGTLTIQKNGTNIKTFSANQTGNVTANITVPTSASDVSAVPVSKVLTTAEQINANTNSANVAGATAVKAMVNQINSNLTITEYSFTYADGFSDCDEWWTTKAYKCGHIVFVRINCKCSRDISGVETMLYIKSAVHNLFETCNNGTFIVMRDHIEISPGAIISAGSWIRGYVITLI